MANEHFLGDVPVQRATRPLQLPEFKDNAALIMQAAQLSEQGRIADNAAKQRALDGLGQSINTALSLLQRKRDSEVDAKKAEATIDLLKARENLTKTNARLADFLMNQSSAEPEITEKDGIKFLKKTGAKGQTDFVSIPGQAQVLAADLKKQKEDEKAESMRQGVIKQATRVMGTIDEAMGQAGKTTAGLSAGILRNVPGSGAKNLAANLTTIKANLGFSELQAMRQASPTGGALGQVAVQELEALQSAVSSLDQLQSPAQLKKHLNDIKKHYQNWIETVNKDASGQSVQQGAGITTDMKEAAKKLLESRRNKGGKK